MSPLCAEFRSGRAAECFLIADIFQIVANLYQRRIRGRWKITLSRSGTVRVFRCRGKRVVPLRERLILSEDWDVICRRSARMCCFAKPKSRMNSGRLFRSWNRIFRSSTGVRFRTEWNSTVIIFRSRTVRLDGKRWKCWGNCFRRERSGLEIRSFRLRLSAGEPLLPAGPGEGGWKSSRRLNGPLFLFPDQFVEHGLPKRVENVQFGKSASVAEREGNRRQPPSRGVQRIEFHSLSAGERDFR